MSKTAERNNPKLWEKVKAEVTAGSKGGKAGEWSARKAQLAVQEYKKQGGGYRDRKSDDNSLTQWTKEEWGTKSGEKSADNSERYLPKKARHALSKEEYDATTRKKREDTRKGKQFSKQPEAVAAKTAHFRDTGKSVPEPARKRTKAELMREARMLEIAGRSQMNKDELATAVRYAKH